MDLELTGNRALVTGLSAGIGAAIARSLAREGVRVVVHGRDSARAQAVANDINARLGEARVVLGGLAEDAQAARVVEEARGAFGGIDVLINNAGVRGARLVRDHP